MKIFIATFLSIYMLFNFCNAQKKAIKKLNKTSISTAELTSKILALMDSANVHGMGVTIFNNNTIAYKKAFGYKRFDTKAELTDSTNMYGASLSKAVFGVLVMQLVEEGLLDLDVPLESYLDKKIYMYEPQTKWHDDFSALKSDTLYHKITARMCLNHTTGFPNWRGTGYDQRLRVLFEPGSRYSYSGEGFSYLQVVIEKMLGKNLEEIAQERIFKPLGMKNSSYQWQTAFENDFAYGHTRMGASYAKDKDNEPRGASTLETTLNDYSTFLQAVLQQKLLSASSYKELFKTSIRIHSVRQFGPLSHQDSTLNDDIQLGYGLGWGIIQTPYGTGAFKEGHGDGFQFYSILYPEAGIGILLMANSDNGESIFKELLEVSIADTYSPTEWNNYIPYQQLDPIPDTLYGFQCPPCKRKCDTKTFEKAGFCPHCNMELAPKEN